MWVKPTPVVTNLPAGDSVCNGTTLNVILTATVPGATFTWTCLPSSSVITGWADQTIPATLISHTLTNAGNNVEWVTYQIIPAVMDCSGPVFNYTVTVYPTPFLTNNPANQTQCNYLPVGISLQSGVTGATFTWRAFASSVGLTGSHSNTGPGQVTISDTLTNAGFTIEWVTYRLLPSANGCTGDSADYVVTVNPTPDLSNQVTGQSQCNNQNTNITLSSQVTGTLFTWTVTGSSLLVTGYSNSTQPGTTINQILTNSGFANETVTYHIIPHANGCNGDTTDYPVVVYPVPDVTFIPDGQTVCSRQSTGLSLQSQVTGTSFTWSVTGASAGITGYGPGTGNMIQQVLVNSTYVPGWVTYQVVPVANGCTGISNSATVTVDPVPAVSLIPCFDTVTTLTAQPIILKGGIPTGGSFSGTGVSGSTFDPSLAGAGTHQITYSYTNQFGCRDSARLSISNFQLSTFNCGDSLTDIRDNRKYPTVPIGSQCWLAANLNYGFVIGSGEMQRDNCTNEKYCYDDNPAGCSAFGGLYQWSEMMTYTENESVQGFCPPGWHIPTEPEWNTLFTVYISNGFAGSPLKSSGYSGFNALLSGIRFHNNVWKFPGSDPELRSILIWSSTIHGKTKAWAHGFNEVTADMEFTPSVSLYPALQSNAFATRCIKD